MGVEATEDLDAAIREWLRPVPNINQWGGWMRRMHGAVTAVLDVHKPQWVGADTSVREVCSECCESGPGYEAEAALYPCPTVRAIAEKLGVEVDRG